MWCRPKSGLRRHSTNAAMGGVAVMDSATTDYWVEPGTRVAYPTSYWAYRRTREAEEKPPPRHRGFGPEIDRYISRRWRGPVAADVDVVLSFRPEASPRVQRMVGEVLRAIRRGRPAGEAIRHVARRFGLRAAHALRLHHGRHGFRDAVPAGRDRVARRRARAFQELVDRLDVMTRVGYRVPRCAVRPAARRSGTRIRMWRSAWSAQALSRSRP